jgi:two-component system sensor histidine kinase RpfC
MTHLRAVVRRFTGFYRDRGPDPEVEQAWLRVVIATMGFGWCVYLIHGEGEITAGLSTAMVAAGAAALIGLVMIVVLSRSRAHVVPLRYLGILTDMTAISVGMAGANEGGVPMIGVYLWVTVGNGFRFGPRYLMAAYWLQMVGFGLQLLFVPFWITHRAIGLGLLLALAIVPLYVLVLLSRLTAQKDAAEQLSSAKSRFVANVSHELRTPLTGVFAVYDLLRSRALASDERELVGMLGKSIATLKASVDAVLQMSKLEAGAERAQPRVFNLWHFLQQLGALARPQGEAKDLAWSLEVDPEVPPVVVGDPDHLSHVLGNLINNAFKFTHRGAVSLHASATDGWVRFEVRDTGVGIPPEHQSRLFERFVQVDSSATRRFGGTGLGTSIARDLVELMGGRIGVESAAAKGSTFWVELPLGPPAATVSVPNAWGSRREVRVIGTEGSAQDKLVATLHAIGVVPRSVRPAPAPDLPRDAHRYLAALLRMPAASAVAYAKERLAARAGADCPWVVLAPEYSMDQRRALIRMGAAELLSDASGVESLRASLAALESRLELDGAEDVGPLSQGGLVRPLSILLADDNPSNQMLLSRILRDAGHRVQTAARGGEAFDAMATGAIDLAILDLNMPDMTGPDVVKLFRAGSVGAPKLPVLMLSADATPAARQESLGAGADEFLTKPVTAAGLLAAIERMVAGGAARVDGTARPPAAASAVTLGAGSTLVDLERVHSLRGIASGDAAFLSRYLTAAFDEIERAIDDLCIAAKAGQERAARDALHIIEGTGASIGGVALTTSCRAMRGRLVQDGDLGGALAEFRGTYALTKSAVLATMREAPRTALRERVTK